MQVMDYGLFSANDACSKVMGSSTHAQLTRCFSAVAELLV